MDLHRIINVAAAAAFTLALTSPAQANWQTLVNEDFSDDPVAAGRANVTGDDPNAASRFTHTGNGLTAGYNGAEPTALLNWDLGRTLTQDDTFGVSTTFSIDALNADAFGQLAFGFLNSVTTGTDRTSGIPGTDSFDLLSVDYYADDYLGTTVIPTDDGGDPSFLFPWGPASTLDSPLPEAATLTAELTYTAANQIAALQIFQDGSPITFNATAGTTIQTETGGAEFAVDAFSLTLWKDNWLAEGDTFTGDLTFSDLTVSTMIPEPHAAALLGLGATVLLGRRRGRRELHAVGG
ncbi:MAG: hypothetical protein WD294_04495 [Phycisphaeraceae bacterium]